MLEFLFSLFSSDRQSTVKSSARAPANSDVLEGWEYSATLSLDTPLEALEHDGEVRKTSRRNLPDYGGPAAGVWLPKTRSFQDLGIDAPEFENGERASEIGYAPADGGTFLEFLKDFRRIVEGRRTVPDKIEAIRNLREENESYRKHYDKLEDGFAEKFFAKKFCEINGVGEATALELFRNGFQSLQELCGAEDEAILNVPGIGEGTLRSIRSHCEAKKGIKNA